ncbi:MAG: DUF4156 domain-containing protein [Pseudomonadales bacterium]|nr:DUF4156 domain-containing protein [Pseudomonadales bacterium]
MRRIYRRVVTTTLIVLPAACTWVPLEDEAVAVALRTESEVTDCKRLGTTDATTREKLGVVERSEQKVATELLTLAKNSAASMGGDTIVEQGPMEHGEQTFVVYRCAPR